MLGPAGPTPLGLEREVLFNGQPEPLRQTQVDPPELDMETCGLCKKIPGQGLQKLFWRPRIWT